MPAEVPPLPGSPAAQRGGRGFGAMAGALGLMAGCAPLSPAPDADRAERFITAHAQLLPIGRVMAAAAEQDPRWPLGQKAAMVSASQLACMRQALSPADVDQAQRARARAYAQAYPETLDDELRVLEGGAARLMGESMLAGVHGAAASPAPATTTETEALAAFATEPRFARLRQANGLGALGGGAPGLSVSQRGQRMSQALVVNLLSDAFLRCHIPIKLIY